MFWRPTSSDDATVECWLCSHQCTIKEGQLGVCKVRENRGGAVIPLAWGKLLALNPDPIEKKPLSHFQPGTRSLSIASAGCNYQCRWCQNHSMAQSLRRGLPIRGESFSPEVVVELAQSRGCASISYTYSEPTIHYEFNRAVGVLAREQGLKNVFVTNGSMGKDAARDAAESFLDAANVDLKAMRTETYKKHIKAGKRGLEGVLETIETLHRGGVWVEVTTLVIPGLNDSEEELRDAARFIASVSPNIPWHLSRYHPDHDWLDAPATPIATLRRSRELGLDEGLRFVYTGNVWGDPGEHTYCPSCGEMVIRRSSFEATPCNLRRDRCAACGATIAGVEMERLDPSSP